jgi:hypothetical protein
MGHGSFIGGRGYDRGAHEPADQRADAGMTRKEFVAVNAAVDNTRGVRQHTDQWISLRRRRQERQCQQSAGHQGSDRTVYRITGPYKFLDPGVMSHSNPLREAWLIAVCPCPPNALPAIRPTSCEWPPVGTVPIVCTNADCASARREEAMAKLQEQQGALPQGPRRRCAARRMAPRQAVHRASSSITGRHRMNAPVRIDYNQQAVAKGTRQ